MYNNKINNYYDYIITMNTSKLWCDYVTQLQFLILQSSTGGGFGKINVPKQSYTNHILKHDRINP